MPLTPKGVEIKREMIKEYGKKRGTQIFFASANKGTITGVHGGHKIHGVHKVKMPLHR